MSIIYGSFAAVYYGATTAPYDMLSLRKLNSTDPFYEWIDSTSVLLPYNHLQPTTYVKSQDVMRIMSLDNLRDWYLHKLCKGVSPSNTEEFLQDYKTYDRLCKKSGKQSSIHNPVFHYDFGYGNLSPQPTNPQLQDIRALLKPENSKIDGVDSVMAFKKASEEERVQFVKRELVAYYLSTYYVYSTYIATSSLGCKAIGHNYDKAFLEYIDYICPMYLRVYIINNARRFAYSQVKHMINISKPKVEPILTQLLQSWASKFYTVPNRLFTNDTTPHVFSYDRFVVNVDPVMGVFCVKKDKSIVDVGVLKIEKLSYDLYSPTEKRHYTYRSCYHHEGDRYYITYLDSNHGREPLFDRLVCNIVGVELPEEEVDLLNSKWNKVISARDIMCSRRERFGNDELKAILQEAYRKRFFHKLVEPYMVERAWQVLLFNQKIGNLSVIAQVRALIKDHRKLTFKYLPQTPYIRHISWTNDQLLAHWLAELGLMPKEFLQSSIEISSCDIDMQTFEAVIEQRLSNYF